jgi:hypothetical protein
MIGQHLSHNMSQNSKFSNWKNAMCRDLFNIPDNDVKQAVNAENLKSWLPYWILGFWQRSAPGRCAHPSFGSKARSYYYFFSKDMTRGFLEFLSTNKSHLYTVTLAFSPWPDLCIVT